MQLGDTVYYINAIDSSPIGEIIGIRETRWSCDNTSDMIYIVQTRHGTIRNIYDKDSITNEDPAKKIADCSAK